MDIWEVCVRTANWFFCCLVLVSHCHRHVPLIASTRVRTIVLRLLTRKSGIQNNDSKKTRVGTWKNRTMDLQKAINVCNHSPVTVLDLQKWVSPWNCWKHDRLTKHGKKIETEIFPRETCFLPKNVGRMSRRKMPFRANKFVTTDSITHQKVHSSNKRETAILVEFVDPNQFDAAVQVSHHTWVFWGAPVAKRRSGIAPLSLQALIWRRLTASKSHLGALRQQHVPTSHCALLWNWYRNQQGCISGREIFDIARGARKSDVISLLFFNANLEHALRQWKRTSKTNGFQIGAVQKLTNVRHADDIMIHAKCMDELVDVELWTFQKHKFWPMFVCKNSLTFWHRPIKIFGKQFNGLGTHVEFDHLLHTVWAKFLTYKRIILNKQVSLKLKLKRFDSVVSPTAMFGLAILPLTKVQIDKLDVMQRRMLRSIVGWVRTHNEQWQDTMRKMNGRFELRWRCVWFVSGQFFFPPP